VSRRPTAGHLLTSKDNKRSPRRQRGKTPHRLARHT